MKSKIRLNEAKIVKKKKERHRRHDNEACSNETSLAMRKPYCGSPSYQPKIGENILLPKKKEKKKEIVSW